MGNTYSSIEREFAIAARDYVSADSFFERYIRIDLLANRPDEFLDTTLYFLGYLNNLNETRYKELHKGTAFYFLGISSFLVHSYQMAAYFFDAALSEDIRAGKDPENDTAPAFCFMLIKNDIEQQQALLLVKNLKSILDFNIELYYLVNYDKIKSSNNLNIESIRKNFLLPMLRSSNCGKRSIVTTFISYLLESNYISSLFRAVVTPGTLEPFYFNLLKGCILFESLLKENILHSIKPKRHTLNLYLNQLWEYLSLSENDCWKLSKKPITLNELLYYIERDDNKITYNIDTAIKITYNIRNTLAHSISWGITLAEHHYDLLYKMISSSILHAVACLYIP